MAEEGSFFIKAINFAVPIVDASGAEITHFTFKYSLNYNSIFLTLEFHRINKTMSGKQTKF